MKFFAAILLMVTSLCAVAQKNELAAGVYNWSNVTSTKIGVVEKREVLKGNTLDLKLYEIYTLTLPAGKAYIPPIGDINYEQLIVVKSGKVKLYLKDTSATVGPGSIALVLAGDKIRFEAPPHNAATWYVINYQSVNTPDLIRSHTAGPSFIKNWDLLKVNKSTKGETRSLFDRPTSMFERFEVHATALNPGFASHDPHTHRVEELILMLNGNVLETIGNKEIPAQAGDCIYLQSGILHRPINNANQQCYYLAIQWHNLKTD